MLVPAIRTLPGWLGVQINDALQARGLLELSGDMTFAVTEKAGRAWFEDMGVTVLRSTGRQPAKFARPCNDWTERRPHLAGTLGVSLYRRLLELGWITAIPGTRAVRVTSRGKQELSKRLGLRLG